MANVAVITARGGSKRIPRKNIKDFLGKPILIYSIEAACASGLFDYVMVSTDDEEIAEMSKKFGAEVPFVRSKKNSDDFAGTADVIIEVLQELKGIGKEFANVCCIYPTAPFVTKRILAESYELLVKEKLDTVFPVCAFSYPIQRALRIQNFKTNMVWPENEDLRSQELEPRYHDAGQFYWINTDAFLKEKKLFTANTGSIILDELRVQDIDNETDWKLAELKYGLLSEA